MRNLINPRWLIVINTIPVLILAAIYFSAFQVIHTLLEPESIELWKKISLALLGLWATTLAYALALIQTKRTIHPIYGLVALIFYIPFIYIFGYNSQYLIPWSIPSWMVPNNMILYIGSFLMPTLAHALLILVIGITPPREGGYRTWKNFVLAGSIPLAWYLFVEVVLPLWRPYNHNLGEYTILLAVISSTTLFLLLLARGIYILVQKKGEVWKKYQLLWKIPVGIIFPLMGLALNNGEMVFDPIDFDGVFGDFSNPWFYILAIINGVLLCIPKPAQAFHRLLLFALQSVTFSYTLYFFLVFIPFLPLSVIGIIAFGLGFLLLTPLALMILHSMDLSSDFRFLSHHYSRKMLLPIFLFGVFSIPLALTYNYTLDRIALQDALTHIYQSDFDKTPIKKVNQRGLKRVITTLRSHKKNQRNSDLSIGQTPFLSPFYNWLVLDNLTLSENKMRTIEDVFFGKHEHITSWRSRNVMPESNGTTITDIRTQSTYDATQKSWKTWVDLDITNTTNGQREFVTNFKLPDGAWITDYYLMIEGERVPGILAEKKTATWVYQQIVSRRRDPGILYYLENRNIAFRVFPFTGNQTRQTGFQIIHKEPLSFELDGQEVVLGDPTQEETILSEAIFSANEKIVYLPAALKATLPTVHRTPYYHFIVDCSIGKDSLLSAYLQKIETLVDQNPALAKNGKITFTNAYCETISLSDNWQQKLKQHEFSGGFNLERAIKKILVQQGAKPTPVIPKIVAFSNHINQAIVPINFAEYAAAVPDLSYFEVIPTDGEAMTFSLQEDSRSMLSPDQIEAVEEILAWPNATKPKAYLSAKAEPSIVLLDPMDIQSLENIKQKKWMDALTLEGQYRSYYLYPENKDQEWNPMIRNSLANYVLTPLMSFISLENEAQRTALLKKQKQVLNGNEALDLSEDAHKMSEPGFGFFLIILTLWMVWKRRKGLNYS